VRPPLVSVIVPAYNAGAHIVETLESALAQTHPRCEVIVVDDGSTDDTWERIAPFAGRVRLLRQANAGGGASRNAGLRVAAGDYIAFLDHDDLWHPEKLAVQLRVAARHPESGVVACDGLHFDGDRILRGHLLSDDLVRRLAGAPAGELTGWLYRRLLEGNFIFTPAQTLISRRVIERVGPLSEARDEPYDYEYYLRVSVDHPITLHAERLVGWRYLATGRSGPEAERLLRWTVMDLPVLRRQLRCCPAGEQRYVRRALRRRAQRARLAYEFSRRVDRATGRRLLRQMWRRAPGSPQLWRWLLASHWPGRWPQGAP